MTEWSFDVSFATRSELAARVFNWHRVVVLADDADEASKVAAYMIFVTQGDVVVTDVMHRI